jgi:RNA polymerase subunit RPABC4/transcription elongation factor Spt4
MARNKMKICKHCGAEIAKSAKVCPVCGGKNPKPIYKRVWFWLLVIVVLLGGLGSRGGGSEETSKENIEYTAVTVDEMFAELDKNAANAEEKYNDAYVSVTGRLSVIDSDGSYIALEPLDNEYTFDSVHCTIKTEEQLKKVKSLSKGDTVTVKGQITDVGEVMGYSMNIDSID